MIKMLPENLRRMTKTQKQMCGCEHCIDGRSMFQSLMEWRNGCLKEFDDTIKLLLEAGDSVNAAKVQAKRDEYFSDAFEEPTEGKNLQEATFIGDNREETAIFLVQREEKIAMKYESFMKEAESETVKFKPPTIKVRPQQKVKNIRGYCDLMTCQPINPDGVNLCTYDCCLDRCKWCPSMKVPDCEMIGYTLTKKFDGRRKERVRSQVVSKLVSTQVHVHLHGEELW